MSVFSETFKAEILAVRKDRWLFALVFWLPPVVSLFLLLIFSAGQPLNLPVGVVDLDQSSLSRKVARYLDASPALSITRHYSSLTEGKADLGDASVYALIVIPANLSRDVIRGEAPSVTAFFNAQYLLIGKAIRSALIVTETTLAAELDVGKTLANTPVIKAALAIALPVRSQMTALYNQNMNYATFLVPALLAAMLQLMVICVTILSLGKNTEQCESPLRTNLVTRLAGPLFFYTCVFSIHILASIAFLYGALDWPHQLSLNGLVPLVFLFVMACQLLGAFFFVLTFDLVKSLSLAGAFSAPAFAFLGVTFPASDMSVFAQFWRDLMPAAHYLNGFLDQVSYGAGFGHSLKPGLLMFAFAVLIPVIVYRIKDRQKEAL